MIYVWLSWILLTQVHISVGDLGGKISLRDDDDISEDYIDTSMENIRDLQDASQDTSHDTSEDTSEDTLEDIYQDQSQDKLTGRSSEDDKSPDFFTSTTSTSSDEDEGHGISNDFGLNLSPQFGNSSIRIRENETTLIEHESRDTLNIFANETNSEIKSAVPPSASETPARSADDSNSTTDLIEELENPFSSEDKITSRRNRSEYETPDFFTSTADNIGNDNDSRRIQGDDIFVSVTPPGNSSIEAIEREIVHKIFLDRHLNQAQDLPPHFRFRLFPNLPIQVSNVAVNESIPEVQNPLFHSTLDTVDPIKAGNDDPISDLTMASSGVDSVSLTWNEKHLKTIHCIYQLNGETTSSYTIKTLDTFVNFTLFSLPHPGMQYEFSISCECQDGKNFTNNLTILTRPAAIPRLNITTREPHSVTVEWFQPGHMDDAQVFMDDRELSIELTKPVDDEKKVKLKILDLSESGVIYHVTIYVISNLMRSEGYDVHVSTAPHRPGDLDVTEEHETSVVLTWNQTGNFHDFIVKLNDAVTPASFKFNGERTTVACTLNGEFSPGSYHVISVTGVSVSGDESEPRIYEYVKDPSAPGQIKYVASNATSTCFSWRQPGHYDAIEVFGHNDLGKVRLRNWTYEVLSGDFVLGCISGAHDTYYGFVVRVVRKNLKASSPTFFFSAFKPPVNVRVTNVEMNYAELWLDMTSLTSTLPFNMLDFVITSLDPGSERSQYVAVTSFTVMTELNRLNPGSFYQVRVSGVSPFYDDLPRSDPVFFVTLPLSPGFSSREIKETTIKLDGILPTNCDHIQMTISKSLLTNPARDGWPREISIPCNSGSFLLEDLEANTMYTALTRTFSTAYNTVQFGGGGNESFQARSMDVTINLWTKPKPVKNLKALSVNSSSVTLDWSFEETQTFHSMPEFHPVHHPMPMANNRHGDFSRHYAIKITVLNATGFRVQTAVLTCVDSPIDLHTTECPRSYSIIDLTPSTNYSVQVNVKNPASHSKDGVIYVRTEPLVVVVVQGNLILIGILSPILIAIFLIVVFILIRKFILAKPEVMQPESVKMVELENYLSRFRKNFKHQLALQYALLNQQSPQHPTTTAELPENRSKNRFSNVLPFDHSRVKLINNSEDGASDYINASFVPGYLRSNGYIATQAPLKDTLNDFWRMIHQQNVDTVVMLTNVVEDGKERCRRYWPYNEEVKSFTDFQVRLKMESQLNHYIKRSLEIREKDGKWKALEHFQFLSWPDVETWDDVKVVVSFLLEVRQHLSTNQHNPSTPVLVHCSPGSGRTGTFILLDRLHEQMENLESSGEINIFEVAVDLRNARPHLVQTERQYEFVHQCLLYSMNLKSTDTNSGASPSDAASTARMSISSRAPSDYY